ncbi:MAG: hypothetical protein F7O42_08860 [Opitutae bacterium]|nr:hypothetical protein [Opitutae bacterium]
MMKMLNWIFFLIFLLGAVLQFNDPDPVIWMAMWGAAAGACLLFGLGIIFRAVPLAIGIVALVWAAILIPEVVKSAGDLHWKEVFNVVTMSSMEIEWVREMGGLLIIAAWMGIIYLSSRK